MIELNVGFDVGGCIIIVDKDGDYYILNGVKCFIINGFLLEIFLVFVLIDKIKGVKGLLVFIVEKGFEGFFIGKVEDKCGIRFV